MKTRAAAGRRIAVVLALALQVGVQSLAAAVPAAAQATSSTPTTTSTTPSTSTTTTTAKPSTTTTLKPTTTTTTTTTKPSTTTTLKPTTTTTAPAVTTTQAPSRAAATPALAGSCAAPAAPTGVTATAGDNLATVTWTAAADNGSAVTRYVVSAYVGNAAKVAEATDGAATSVVLSGLAGGVAHTFKVVATSACGDGPPGTSAAVTPTGAAGTYATAVAANSPVAYYRLGEDSGTTAADSSGQGRHGTYDYATLGAPGALVGDPDTAVGATGNPVAHASPPVPLYNSARTVEAWVRPADASARYVASWGTYGTRQEFGVLVGATSVGVTGYNDDRSFPTPRPINDGAWHHVVVTYDGTTLTAYLDAQSLGTRTFAAPLDTLDAYGLHIGSHFDGGTPAYGGLDEVAVYPAALTATQIATHFAASGYAVPTAPRAATASYAGDNQLTISWGIADSANSPVTRYLVTAYIGTTPVNAVSVAGTKTAARISGLQGGTSYTFQVVASNAYGDGPAATTLAATAPGVTSTYPSVVLANTPSAYYRLGDRSGPTGADSSGKARHATYEDVVLGAPGAVMGDPDTSVTGDGYGELARSAPTLPTSNAARSVEAWVRPTDTSTRYVASWGNYGTDQEFSVVASGDTVGVVGYNDDRYFRTPRPLNDGAWHHVVLTYSGTTLSGYLDGVWLGNRTFSAPLDTIDGSGLHIGSRLGDPGSAFYGDLDELAIYPVSLTAAQVSAHFAASGLGRPDVPTGVGATAGVNSATVSWSPAASATPLTRYVVTAYAGTVAKVAEATGPSATDVVLSGLSGTTAYTFQVVATNAYGDGPAGVSAAVTPTGSSTTYASTVLTDAPGAYYRLGEDSGPTAADSSGKGGHGTYASVTLPAPGAVVGDPDTAATAAGSEVVRSAPTLPLSNAYRSVEAWVKPTDSSNRYVVSWGSGGTDQEFSLVVGSQTLSLVAGGDNPSFATPRPLNDGAWHHVAVTYNGGTLTGYLDGLSLGTRTFGAALDTVDGSGLHIGARFNGESPFYGNLDEVAIYTTALSATQVANHFAASGFGRPAAPGNVTATPGTNEVTVSWAAATSPNTPVTRYLVTAYAGTVAKGAEAVDGNGTSVVLSGLPGGTAYTFQVVASNAYGDGAVTTSPSATPTGPASTYVSSVLANAPVAYYRLGDMSGRTAADSSGKGRHGLYDQVTLGATGAPLGDTDASATANGGCCVARSSPTLPLYNTARTVEAWVKPADTSFRYIAGWGTATPDRAFSVGLDGSNIGVSAYFDDRYFAIPHPLNDGAWHHVVVTYSGSSIVVYLDGLSLGTKTFAAPLTTLSPSGLLIGADFQSSQPFYGGLDEVSVYPVALSAAQVTAHFDASGLARPSAATGLTVAPGSNQATVSWAAASSPATPVTRYIVTAYAGTAAKNSEAVDGASTSVVLSGLPGGTAYTFQVVASNAYGDGPPATSAATTPTGSTSTYVSSVLSNTPSAYYRLGESSGSTAADSSGKGKHGAYAQVGLGAGGTVVGDPDTAVTGNGSCCIARSMPALPVLNTARSVEAWVKPSDSAFRYIAGWGAAVTDRSFSVGFDASNIGVLAYNDDRYFALPYPLTDGVWHHLVLTYSGSTIVAYVDGVSVGTQTFTSPLATRNDSGLMIGADFQGGAPSYGGLDEVAVYPAVLTAAQVTAHFSASGLSRPAAPASVTVTAGANQATVSWSAVSAPATPLTRYVVTAYAGTTVKNAESTAASNTSLVMSGLQGGTAYTFKVVASNAYGDGPAVTSAAATPTGSATTYASTVLSNSPSAYYRLGDTSGRTAADSSGRGRHAIYDQVTLNAPGAIAGDPDTGVTANGSCCVARATPTLPQYNTARTVEAWVKPSDTSFRYIAGWGTSAKDRTFSVGLDGTNIGVIAYDDDRYFALPKALNDGVWHHIVVTYNGTSVVAYLDGVSLGSQTFNAPLGTLTAYGLFIGADYAGGTPSYGGLDEVAIYPVALTAAQVTAHFNAKP